MWLLPINGNKPVADMTTNQPRRSRPIGQGNRRKIGHSASHYDLFAFNTADPE
ncbi:MAG: hypothetical protein R2822_07815 [Spirosomataceae bacterium]